ncbi:peptidylprolyl isomerase [Candidatus Poribacteria bacterium]|nr:peptidylprolyl isomerase [Candidatus Poribacteria bacterium]
MLRQQRINGYNYIFWSIICVFVVSISGCAQQDQQSSSTTTETTKTTQQTDTKQEEVKPITEVVKSTPQTKPAIDPANAIAVIETDKGTIEFEFYADDAPITAKAFIKNANLDYYKNEKFHRVEELIVQAGSAFVDDTLPIEKSLHPLVKGVVLMAKVEGETVSDADEFFICKQPIILDDDFTTLGKVIKGLDVLDNLVQDDRIINISIREREKE